MKKLINKIEYKPTDRQNKKAVLIFAVHILILLFLVSIPDELLHDTKIIIIINEFMQNIIPSLDGFLIYSAFPVSSIFAYSVAIILMPLFVFHLAKTFSKNISPEELERIKFNSFETYILRPIFYILLIILPFSFFPGNPEPMRSVTYKLNAWVYSSKIGFSIGCSIVFLGAALGVILIFSHVRLIMLSKK